jgi:hypothetical protein
MADGERTKVRLDAFTAKVVPDPKNPTESLLLTGFLGASSESKQTRIYWDASLSSYVDVDTADIIHSEPLAIEQSPLGGSYIWVKRSAEVSIGSAGGSTAKGKFFQGPVMAAYGTTFGAGGAGAQTLLSRFCDPTPICFLTPFCPGPATPQCTMTVQCWFSWDVECRLTPACPPGATPAGLGPMEAAAQAPQAIPSLICSPGLICWFSWRWACPQAPAPAAEQAIPGSYAPHCWYSWNACPTEYGCGPHRTPGFPQAPAYPPYASLWCRTAIVPCLWSIGSCGHPCTR